MDMIKVYVKLAQCTTHYKAGCENENANDSITDQWEDMIERICKNHLPSGSGFDCGTRLDIEKSNSHKLVFHTPYHHMNDGGYYDGWSDITIAITANLTYGFDMRITGIHRKDCWHMVDYVADTFNYDLNKEIPNEYIKVKV